MAGKTLIKDVTIITMNDNNDIINNGNILIENNFIKKITGEPLEETDGEFNIISGKGKVAIPGLINLHNHAAMTLFRGYADDLPLKEWLETKIFPAEDRLTGEDVYWGTSLAVLEMLKGGTTTFADMYFFMDDVAKICQETGIRAVLSQGIVGFNDIVGKETLNKAKTFVNSWSKDNGLITTMLGPHAPYTCPPDFLAKVLEEADKLGVPVHIHLAETKKEYNDCLEQYKKTPIALMKEIGLFERQVLAAHCVHLSQEDIFILAEKQTGIAHNPGSNLKLGSGISPINKLIKEGAVVGLGTDGASSNNNLDMLEEVRLAALLQKGYYEDPTLIPAETALAMATREGAKALKIEDRGIISEGMKADLVLLNCQKPHLQPSLDVVANIVYSASANDVDTVIIDGNVLVEKGDCLTIDEEKVYFEAQKRAENLTKGLI